MYSFPIKKIFCFCKGRQTKIILIFHKNANVSNNPEQNQKTSNITNPPFQGNFQNNKLGIITNQKEEEEKKKEFSFGLQINIPQEMQSNYILETFPNYLIEEEDEKDTID